jgi:branched-chain amino acid aminotransferase
VTTKVLLDGVLFDPPEAKVSVFDRGFLYGDSVYEVVRTYDGRPFALGEHLQRLAWSAARLGIALPVPVETIRAEVAECLRAAGNPDSYIRIVVTRGAGEIGLDPALAVDPVRLVIVRSLPPQDPRLYAEGAKVALVVPMREPAGVHHPARRGDSTPDGSPKTGNYLPNVLAVGEARRRGAYEALLVDREGRVLEGASSNVFVARGGALATPPLSEGILEGITRKHVLSIAAALGVATAEVALRAEDLRGADEVFITSTVREVVPVTDVDGVRIGDGRPGALTRRITEAFRARARAEAAR